MAKVNDLQCVGDALFQSDVKVNGKLNNEVLDIDDNCLIINVCRRLDLSAVNNEVQIDLPSGYVCNPTAIGSAACVGVYTYDDQTSAWTTDATVELSTMEAQGGATVANSNAISHGMMTTKGLVPFCKTYIKAKVTTAAVGTNTYMMMFGTIYCKKL